jgi:hypothetical protein
LFFFFSEKSHPLFIQAHIRDSRQRSARRYANWLLAGIHVCLVVSECSFANHVKRRWEQGVHSACTKAPLLTKALFSEFGGFC